ncbi:MAG TPA: SRPBCC family protein [Mucilaginibacter sp.]|nr:SRPBCC family protein [Mucilaginibacter sp.]
MKTYSFQRETFLPAAIDKAWDFFTSPLNLERITPKDMNFVVTSDFKPDSKVYAGMIITYKVSPLWGIRMNWMTEITHVQEKEYFIDEQRFGPYALWHHQHHFKPVEGGVQMTDIVNYAIGWGFIGRVAYELVVAKKLREIFDYRAKVIGEIF